MDDLDQLLKELDAQKPIPPPQEVRQPILQPPLPMPMMQPMPIQTMPPQPLVGQQPLKTTFMSPEEAENIDISQVVIDADKQFQLYVGQINPLTNEQHLREAFGSCGPIKAIVLPNPPKGFCFVNFDTRAALLSAFERRNFSVAGKPVTLAGFHKELTIILRRVPVSESFDEPSFAKCLNTFLRQSAPDLYTFVQLQTAKQQNIQQAYLHFITKEESIKAFQLLKTPDFTHYAARQLHIAKNPDDYEVVLNAEVERRQASGEQPNKSPQREILQFLCVRQSSNKNNRGNSTQHYGQPTYGQPNYGQPNYMQNNYGQQPQQYQAYGAYAQQQYPPQQYATGYGQQQQYGQQSQPYRPPQNQQYGQPTVASTDYFQPAQPQPQQTYQVYQPGRQPLPSQSQQQAYSDTSIYVQRMPLGTTEVDVRKAIQPFGEIQHVVMIDQRAGAQPCSIVHFVNPTSAAAAVQARTVMICGQPTTMMPHRKKSIQQ